jgi:T-complex protein 11
MLVVSSSKNSLVVSNSSSSSPGSLAASIASGSAGLRGSPYSTSSRPSSGLLTGSVASEGIIGDGTKRRATIVAPFSDSPCLDNVQRRIERVDHGFLLEMQLRQMRDLALVEETFNIDLLMQQFRMGVADLVKLANWLSQLLKCYCAPMRDDLVDQMETQLSSGYRSKDVTLLIAGVKNLLNVLEAMKLVS